MSVTTSRPSRVRNQSRVPSMQVGGLVEVVQVDDDGVLSPECVAAQSDEVDRAEPGVGDQQHERGCERVDQRNAVAVGSRWGSGRRRRSPRAPACRRPGSSRTSPARSAIGERWEPERFGGDGRRHRQWEPTVRWAHVGRARRRLPRASTSASVAVSPSTNDCTGLRAAISQPRARNVRSSAAETYVLPTSVPVPATATSVTARGRYRARRSARGAGGRPARRCARPTPSRAAAMCRPERSAVGSRGRGGRRRAARPRRRARAARRRRGTARWATGDRAAAGRRARAGERRAPRLPATARPATPRARPQLSAGVGAVVKMYGRARFSTSSIDRVEPATKPPSAPSVFDSVPIRRTSTSSGTSSSGPSTACASSTTSSAPSRAQRSTSAGEVGDVAVHREHRVGDHERTPRAPVAQERREVVEIAVAIHRDIGPGSESAAVDDRRVVELVAADEHAGSGERGDDAEVRREARGEERGAGHRLPVGELGFELGVYRSRARR